MTEHEFLLMVRQALLMLLDAIERKLEINPRTAELRKQNKCAIIVVAPQDN